LSKDPWEGDELYPQTLNGWNYVEGNPITRLDPTGLSSKPKRPEQKDWDLYAFPWEYSVQALDRLIDLRKHVVAASQRHSFVPGPICTASASQNQLMYSLGAIVYRESLGYDEEVASGESSIAEALARRGISVHSEFPYLGGEIPSVGIGQMRPNTALELENAGFVRVPISEDEKCILIEPNSFEAPDESLICPHCQRVDRLLKPVWAIEYVAANMEYARTRPGYYESQ
jgi:hypothetical protein